MNESLEKSKRKKTKLGNADHGVIFISLVIN